MPKKRRKWILWSLSKFNKTGNVPSAHMLIMGVELDWLAACTPSDLSLISISYIEIVRLFKDGVLGMIFFIILVFTS